MFRLWKSRLLISLLFSSFSSFGGKKPCNVHISIFSVLAHNKNVGGNPIQILAANIYHQSSRPHCTQSN